MKAMEVFFKFPEEAKNSHDINSKLVSAFLSIGRGACCFGNVFICAQICQQWTEKHLPNACTTYPVKTKSSDTILERCVAGKTQNRMKVRIAAFGENAQRVYSSTKAEIAVTDAK
ncbi:hypothetical protein TNCV_4746111 [Trichonephila clavipes]|nr:hypothetical protein TNCV_4746111 [Trichonephila clavipes]